MTDGVPQDTGEHSPDPEVDPAKRGPEPGVEPAKRKPVPEIDPIRPTPNKMPAISEEPARNPK